MVNFDFSPYNFKDKDKALFNLISEMFKITLHMFKGDGIHNNRHLPFPAADQPGNENKRTVKKKKVLIYMCFTLKHFYFL